MTHVLNPKQVWARSLQLALRAIMTLAQDAEAAIAKSRRVGSPWAAYNWHWGAWSMRNSECKNPFWACVFTLALAAPLWPDSASAGTVTPYSVSCRASASDGSSSPPVDVSFCASGTASQTIGAHITDPDTVVGTAQAKIINGPPGVSVSASTAYPGSANSIAGMSVGASATFTYYFSVSYLEQLGSPPPTNPLLDIIGTIATESGSPTGTSTSFSLIIQSVDLPGDYSLDLSAPTPTYGVYDIKTTLSKTSDVFPVVVGENYKVTLSVSADVTSFPGYYYVGDTRTNGCTSNCFASASIDPILAVDPSTPDASDYIVNLSDGIINQNSSVTPLPAALPLFATGLGGLGLLGWRRKRRAQTVA